MDANYFIIQKAKFSKYGLNICPECNEILPNEGRLIKHNCTITKRRQKKCYEPKYTTKPIRVARNDVERKNILPKIKKIQKNIKCIPSGIVDVQYRTIKNSFGGQNIIYLFN